MSHKDIEGLAHTLYNPVTLRLQNMGWCRGRLCQDIEMDGTNDIITHVRSCEVASTAAVAMMKVAADALYTGFLRL